MKNPLFTGVCTALVTPFLNGEVNYPMLERLIARQLEGGVHAIVLCGTTGRGRVPTYWEKPRSVIKQEWPCGRPSCPCGFSHPP